MYDEVEILFTDGTTTLIYVSEDDDIAEAIAEECERNGWDIHEVQQFCIRKTIEERG